MKTALLCDALSTSGKFHVGRNGMRIFCLAILIWPICGKVYAENIFEIYKTIPAKFLSEDMKHNFYQKQSQWFTTSATEDPLKVKADLKNGYVSFSDEGTGGGVGYVAIALFRNDAGDPIIAQTSSSQEGFIYYSDAKIHFFKRKAGKWVKISPIPKIDRHIFFPKVSEDLYQKHESSFRLLYRLPHFGTDLIVNLHIDYINKYPGTQESANEIAQNKAIRDARKVQKIIFSWDRSTESFRLKLACQKENCGNSE